MAGFSDPTAELRRATVPLPSTEETRAAARRVINRMGAADVLDALGLDESEPAPRACPTCGNRFALGVHGMSGDARCQRSACIKARREQKTRPPSTA